MEQDSNRLRIIDGCIELMWLISTKLELRKSKTTSRSFKLSSRRRSESHPPTRSTATTG